MQNTHFLKYDKVKNNSIAQESPEKNGEFLIPFLRYLYNTRISCILE